MNRGRRVLKVELAGLAADRQRIATARPCHLWITWGRKHEGLPFTLAESDSQSVYASGQDFARSYRGEPVPRVVFVEDSHGRRHHREIEPALIAQLERAWADDAPSAARAAEREAAGLPQPIDDYGHPIPD